jgi:hypothetical protein
MTAAGVDPDLELRLLREAVAGLERALDALGEPDVSGSLALAAVTVSGGSYPTAGAAGTAFLVQALEVVAPEAEGASAAVTTRPGSFLAVNLASGLPAVGTEVIVYNTGAAWVFAYP